MASHGTRADSTFLAASPGRWSPALRLLVARGRGTTWRPTAVAAAFAARAARMRAYAIWPDPLNPIFAVDLGDPAVSAWLHATFEPDSRSRARIGPATWNAVRARALLVGPPSAIVAAAIARAQAGMPQDVRLALYSPSGDSPSKFHCFVFAAGEPAPGLVVKAGPQRQLSSRLRRETEIREHLRRRTGSSVAAALPPAPRFAGEVDGEFVVVEPVDPLASATATDGSRGAARRWLRDFQSATTRETSPWSERDSEAALAPARWAWEHARPATAAPTLAAVAQRLAGLAGLPVPRCAVHGDFWRGNVASRDGELRIYDWEWAQLEGTPFLDVWTWELGELRELADNAEERLGDRLREAVARVEAELEDRGLDRRFALATLAPSLADVSFRIRREVGVMGGAEAAAARLMGTVEQLLASRPS